MKTSPKMLAALFVVAAVPFIASPAMAQLKCAAGSVVEYRGNGGTVNERAGVFLCVSRPNRNSVCAAGYQPQQTNRGYTCVLQRSRSACRVNGRNSRPEAGRFYVATNQINVGRLKPGAMTNYLRSRQGHLGAFIAYGCAY